MKCPHCEYENGYVWKDNPDIPGKSDYVEIKGEHGDFFKLADKVGREKIGYGYEIERRQVIGCPACLKLFIEE